MSFKEKVKRALVGRLYEKYVNRYKTDDEWAWDTLREIARGSDIAQRRQLIDSSLGAQVVIDELHRFAEEEITKMLANNKLGPAELERIFD